MFEAAGANENSPLEEVMESVMERRALLAGLLVLVACMFMLTGTAFAHKAHTKRVKHSTPHTETTEPEDEYCKVTATPGSFMDTGEFTTSSSVADIVEIECLPVYSEKRVTISAQELYSRCDKELSWTEPPEVPTVTGPEFEVELDNAGNAIAVLWGGPSCAAGESLITADLDAPPYPTVTTAFTVEPPRPSEPGLLAMPEEQVENEESSVASIVYIEFPPEFAEQYVHVQDRQLYIRCGMEPKLNWIGPDENVLEEGSWEAGREDVQLDNDGNAFVVMLGGYSCAAGKTLVEASLEEAPYTTETANFTVLPPQPTKE
jgi:hypothetical protein